MEHTRVVTQVRREAHKGKWDMVVLWLDLAYAYGSIPQKLVKVALLKHHMSSNISDLILYYYNNFNMRITSRSITSDWNWFDKGIITDCTISVIIFPLAMNMVVKSTEVDFRGPLTKTGVWQPSLMTVGGFLKA